MSARVLLPVQVTPERASALIRERVPAFPVCSSWPEVQRECERWGVEIRPARLTVAPDS